MKTLDQLVQTDLQGVGTRRRWVPNQDATSPHDRAMGSLIDRATEGSAADFVVYWVDGGPPRNFSYPDLTPAPVVVTSRYVELATTLYRLMSTELPDRVLGELSGRFFMQMAAEYLLRDGDPVTASYLMTGSLTVTSVYYLPHATVEGLRQDILNEDYMIDWFYGLAHELGHVATRDRPGGSVLDQYVDDTVDFVLEHMDSEELIAAAKEHRARGDAVSIERDHLTDEMNADIFGMNALLDTTSVLLGDDLALEKFCLGLVRMHKARGMMQLIANAAARLTQDWMPPDEDPFTEVATYARTQTALSSLAELLALNTDPPMPVLELYEELSDLEKSQHRIVEGVHAGVRLAASQIRDAAERDATVADGLAEMIAELPDRVGYQAAIDGARFFGLVDEMSVQHRDIENLRALIDGRWAPTQRTLYVVCEESASGGTLPVLFNAGQSFVVFAFRSEDSQEFQEVLATSLDGRGAQGVEVTVMDVECDWDWQAAIWLTALFPEEARHFIRVLVEETPVFDRVMGGLRATTLTAGG